MLVGEGSGKGVDGTVWVGVGVSEASDGPAMIEGQGPLVD
jgi:hypothetical protein